MKKRLISLLLASMMVFALAVPAMADDPPTYAGYVEGDGIIVAPPHIIEVTLPTAPINFLVDVEGVIGEHPVRGAIIFRSGEVQTIINRSSRALNVGAEFLLSTGDDDAEVTFLAANTNLNQNAKNAFITATVSTANVGAPPDDANPFAGTAVQALGLAEYTAEFRLPAAAFDVVEQPAGSGNFVRVKNATPNYQGTAIRLAGAVSNHLEVDWTGDEEIGIRIRFAFTNVGVSLNAPAAHDPVAAHLIRWNQDPLTDFIAQTMDVGGILAGPTQNLARSGANRHITFDWAGLAGNSGDTARLGTVTLAGATITATAGSGDRTAGRIVITGTVPAGLPAGTHPLVINTTSPVTSTTIMVVIP